MNLSLAWNLADGMNALMVIPNLISLILLSGVVVSETLKNLWKGSLDEQGNRVIKHELNLIILVLQMCHKPSVTLFESLVNRKRVNIVMLTL